MGFKHILLAPLLFILSFGFSCYASEVIQSFNEMSHQILNSGEVSVQCEPQALKEDCPPVHVSPWCEKQYERLQKLNPLPSSPIKRSEDKRSIFFLAEEHGDEQAYSYYEKLLRDKSAGLDCLFLELPNVFQKNFDEKKGIVHERGVFENLSKIQNPDEISRIEIKDFSYIYFLESLVKVAKEQKIKVILVDSSEKVKEDLSTSGQVSRRNKSMAKNILNAYSQKECSQGLSILGSMHLFVKEEKKELLPTDEIVKNELKKLPLEEQILVQKAFVYSPTSQSFLNSMGPCSWLNVLPKTTESYLAGKDFYSGHDIFPEKISTSLKNVHGGIDNHADFVVVLPSELDKTFLLKELNKEASPRKYKHKMELTVEAHDVDLSLRSNSSSLSISFGENSLQSQCLNKCSDLGFRSQLMIKDIKYHSPTIECQNFHPSHTNGATRAPIYKQNATVVAECFCTTKY